jgi:hypothetical protein
LTVYVSGRAVEEILPVVQVEDGIAAQRVGVVAGRQQDEQLAPVVE